MKIGLIAMSGVRAHDRELMEFGLTFPGIVERSRIVASLPSLGLLTLAGLTPPQFEVEYREIADLATEEQPPGRYDLVAISSFTAQMPDAYELADTYRAGGTRVVLGGLHVTARPEEALRHADAIVLGEGEPAWPALVEDFGRGRPRQVYDARASRFDLARAPMPRFELLDRAKYNRITVQTQRGCPFNCEFCAASIRLAPGFRAKPVEKVIAEIRRIKEIWPAPFIEFADDNTFADKRHARKLLHALAEEQIRWFTETDVSIAADEELLELMQASGCAQVLIGFESPAAKALHGIERTSDWKAGQQGKYLRAIEAIQSHGISVNGCFVLGLDGTGRESFAEVAQFVRDSGLHEVQITVMTPFPGTPLYDRLQREGRLISANAWELCTLFDVNFRPEGMSVGELREGFRGLVAELYSEEARGSRRRSFARHIRGSKVR